MNHISNIRLRLWIQLNPLSFSPRGEMFYTTFPRWGRPEWG